MTDIRTPECPSCSGTSVVKNGKVRGHQRYKCKFCQKNFSQEFEHRWPNDSRLLNLLLLAVGTSRDEVAEGCGATPETVDRWLLDAKEQKGWFISALADAVYNEAAQHSKSLEDAFEDAIKVYCMVTKDSSELGVTRLAQKLWDLLVLRGESAKFNGFQ